MIRVSAVSYLNTRPFIYGLKNGIISDQIELELDFPAICADKLLNNQVNIGLIPITMISKLDTPQIISEYCIGSDGAVDTVCLYSNVPIFEIQSISLDYQSRTSIELLKILLSDYWKVNPKLMDSEHGFEDNVNSTHAALVIGDRAFELNTRFKYIYDLSVAWKALTGLPFVFATWVSNVQLSGDFISDFNLSLEYGMRNIGEAISDKDDYTNAYYYLNNRISYILDVEKKKAMKLFLQRINS